MGGRPQGSGACWRAAAAAATAARIQGIRGVLRVANAMNSSYTILVCNMHKKRTSQRNHGYQQLEIANPFKLAISWKVGNNIGTETIDGRTGRTLCQRWQPGIQVSCGLRFDHLDLGQQT